MKHIFLLILLLVNITKSFSQDAIQTKDFDKVSFGYGLGMEHGGAVGINLTWYAHKNIGVFSGIGLNFSGLGYNTGVKARLRTTKQKSNISPYLIAMYGVNAGIVNEKNKKYTKNFKGSTIGLGFDFGPKIGKSGYFTAGLLFPITGKDFEEYIDLQKQRGYSFKNDFTPVTITFGLKFILSKH